MKYHVKTIVCGFTPGAHLTLVGPFGTFAAALSFGCKMITAAAMAAAFAAASGYLFVVTTACGCTTGAHISLVERFVTSAAAFCFVFMKVVAAATQCAASWAAAFVESLASVVCQIVTLSGILVFVFSACAGRCWAIARVSPRRSLEPCASGDVLGLRLLGSCDIALMSQRCVNEDAQAFDEASAAAFKNSIVSFCRFLPHLSVSCCFLRTLPQSCFWFLDLRRLRHEGDLGKPGRHRRHHGWSWPRSPLNPLPSRL